MEDKLMQAIDMRAVVDYKKARALYTKSIDDVNKAVSAFSDSTTEAARDSVLAAMENAIRAKRVADELAHRIAHRIAEATDVQVSYSSTAEIDREELGIRRPRKAFNEMELTA